MISQRCTQGVEDIPKPKYRIVIDPDRCRGCGLCELVCSILHEGEARPSASRIKVRKDRENYRFEPLVCLHCTTPKCVLVCPVGAIVVERRIGARIIIEELCTGCGLCVKACPLASHNAVIFQHPSKRTYVKCDLCYWREEGPACVEVCPTQAITLSKVGTCR
ncbi:MAG: 4Fe-4S dicluster domain-containing protein [Thermoprotei archaeon]|nr:4Fe-4S dicluster domain-containing protein [Thermoprotei archaeon]